MIAPPFRTFVYIYFIYFLDLMGYVFAFVVLPPIIVQPEISILDASVSLQTRNLIIGFLLASYPFAQFFASLFLGELSDRFGRKKILVISTFGTFLSFWLSAVAILMKNVPLLFISRLLSGLSAGNLTVTQAAIADWAPHDKKEQYMAFFSIAAGIGWTVGPFIAAFLSNSQITPFFNHALPFWFLGLLFAIGFLMMVFGLKEHREITEKKSLDLHRTFENLLGIFKFPNVKALYLSSIIGIFGWMMYQSFLAPFLIEKYHFTTQSEGYAYAVSSVFWFLGGVVTNQWLAKYFQVKRVLILPFFISGLAILSYLFATRSEWIWGIVSISNFCYSIVLSCFFGMFSRLVPGEYQGKLFGSWNAAFAAVCAIGPFLAGWLVRYWINLPYLVAALMIVVISIYYLRWYMQHSKTL